MLLFVIIEMLSQKQNNRIFLIALAINISIALSYLGLGMSAIQQDMLWRADFTAFYTGGAIIRDGLGNQLYDLNMQAAYQQKFLGERSPPEVLLPFINPPHVAILLVPLAKYSRSVAFLLWTLCQAGLLIWLMVLLWRFTNQWLYRERWLFLTGVLAFYPLFLNFLLGAFSLVTLNCFLMWITKLKHGKEQSTGIWLAVSSFKPQTIVLPALMLLFARKWRVMMFAILTGAIIVFGSSCFLGLSIWLKFLKALEIFGVFFDQYGVQPAAMYNLKGTLAIWLGSQKASLINNISLTGFWVSIGITGWLWRRTLKPTKCDFDLRLGITITIGLLLGLHVNPQDGLLLVVPAAFLYEYLRRENMPKRFYGIFLWICLPICFIGEFTIQDKLGVRLPVLAMLILLGWQAKAILKNSCKQEKNNFRKQNKK